MEWDELVTLQDGVVSRSQATAHGWTRSAISWQLSKGRWQRLRTGIFCVHSGPVLPEAIVWSGLLAAGAGAVLSHESAAAAWGLVRRPEVVTVRIPRDRSSPRLAGVRTRRTPDLAALTHPARIPPRTRVEPTVIDLVDCADDLDDVLAVMATAVQRRLTTPLRLHTEIERRGTFRWRRQSLLVLDDLSAGAHSALEVHYLRHVERAHGLPRGRRQAVESTGLRRAYRDVLYIDYGLLVELDGRLGHADAHGRLARHAAGQPRHGPGEAHPALRLRGRARSAVRGRRADRGGAPEGRLGPRAPSLWGIVHAPTSMIPHQDAVPRRKAWTL